MCNVTVVFDPYAAADIHDFVETIVVNHNLAITGRAEWYPVAFLLKGENGEFMGGLLGDIWAAWLHVKTLAVALPVRKKGFCHGEGVMPNNLLKDTVLYPKPCEKSCVESSDDNRP